MKYSFLKFSLFILIGMFIQACTQEEDLVLPEPEPVLYPDVDEALHTYFSRFEEEAKLRGFSYDLTALGITGTIEEIEEEHVAGQCAYNHFRNPRNITLDRTFWNRSSDSFREFIVFHELGHCVLNRPHLESSLSNGVCSSIMRSGNGECIDYYNRGTRKYYIDELFEIETNLPL